MVSLSLCIAVKLWSDEYLCNSYVHNSLLLLLAIVLRIHRIIEFINFISSINVWIFILSHVTMIQMRFLVQQLYDNYEQFSKQVVSSVYRNTTNATVALHTRDRIAKRGMRVTFSRASMKAFALIYKKVTMETPSSACVHTVSWILLAHNSI